MPNPNINTSADRVTPARRALAGLGVIVSLAGGVTGDYYLNPRIAVHGREIQENITPYELAQTRGALKQAIAERPHAMTINEAMAVEDIVNYSCPNGFSVGPVDGGITVAQINTLLDGNCGV